MAQDREKWLDALNSAINVWIIHTAGNFWTSCGTLLKTVELFTAICVLVYAVFGIVCAVFYIVSFR